MVKISFEDNWRMLMKRIMVLMVILLSIIVPLSYVQCESDENLSRILGDVYLIEDETIQPIPFAKVTVFENETLIYSIQTEINGSYSFMLKPGMYTITVEKTRYISQKAFVNLRPNATLRVNFPLELRSIPISTYEVSITIKGLEDIYPDLLVDGIFKGLAINNTEITFEGETFHTIELGNITLGDIRYIPERQIAYVSSENNTAIFQYKRQFEITSGTHPWIDGWYDEGDVVHLEAREVIVRDISTKMVFDGWKKDWQTIKENPVSITVDRSFNVNSTYKKQYLLTVNTERGSVTGGGWYDEGTLAEISIGEKEIGALPFKYKFIGWTGDKISPDINITILIDGPKEVNAEWERVQSIEVKEPEPIYKAIVSIGLLIVAAKILGGLFSKINLPEVLGELFAGMILGPYALGSLGFLGFGPIIELNEYILGFAEIGAILLLFIAGLEISFSQFKAVGASSIIVGTFGVVVPFFSGLYIMQLLSFPWEVSLLVAAALTATSIAITLRTLESFGRLNSIEGNIMINSAVIDDVLGLVVLAVVISIVTSGSTPLLQDITWILLRTVTFWLILLLIVLTIAPRFVGVAERWETRGTVEAFSTAICFGSAVAAIIIGLSPIVGAFAAGMALAGSKVIVRVRDYIEKLSILFSPIFFAVIGAQFDIRSLSGESIWIIMILLLVAVISKLIGCGIPATIMLRDLKRGFRVGIGMMSRGEIGLIIVGIGITSGILTQKIYGAVVTMVILTTILTPIALRWSYSKKESETIENSGT